MNNHAEPDGKPDGKPTDPSPKKDASLGWIQGLAKRSSGLPEDITQPNPEPKKESGKNAWSYAGIGIQFAATTGFFAFMGLYLDRRMGWTPWGTVTLTLIGLIGGLYLLIKDALKDNKDPPNKGSPK
jgi:ATP synthase protein I